MIRNEEQELAIQSDKRTILVLAGAGSGKTKTLIDKIRFFINRKRINAKNILAITFTKDAIGEIQDRLIEYADPTEQFRQEMATNGKAVTRKKYIERNNVLKSLTVRTFHSLCFSILRENGAGFFDNRFRILPESNEKSGIDETSFSKETITSLLRKSIISACEHEQGFALRLERYLIENSIQKPRSFAQRAREVNQPYRCLNGATVRSKSEQKICDWFHSRGYEIQRAVRAGEPVSF